MIPQNNSSLICGVFGDGGIVAVTGEHRTGVRGSFSMAAAMLNRVSSGNGWRTTYEVGVVCYTLPPLSRKSKGFTGRLGLR